MVTLRLPVRKRFQTTLRNVPSSPGVQRSLPLKFTFYAGTRVQILHDSRSIPPIQTIQLTCRNHRRSQCCNSMRWSRNALPLR